MLTLESTQLFAIVYTIGKKPLVLSTILLDYTLMRFSDPKETSTQTPLLTPFLKNSDKFSKLYFLALLGQLGTNITKVALLLGI